MMEVSTKIKIDMMHDVLGLDKSIFNKKLFDWAAQFGFTIDGDYLIVNRDSIDNFINELDASFKLWNEKERGEEGKIR